MLFRKMLRDLKENSMQFISILLVSFLGVLIFAGMSSIGQGMKQSSTRFYQETNLADAILYGSDFTSEEINSLQNSTLINHITKKLSFDSPYGQDSSITLQVNYISDDTVSGFHLIEGIPFDVQIDGAWLDTSFAKEHNIIVGDAISFTYQNQVISKEVMGLVMHPEYLYALKNENEVIPDHNTFGYIFLPENSWPLADPLPYTQLLIDTNSIDKTDLEKEMNTILPEKPLILLMQSSFSSVAMFRNEIDQMNSMSAIFPIVFLLIAVLTTLTTMTRIVANQRTQIGTLKALGFTNGKILRHYISYGFFIGSTSGLLGLIIGPLALPPLLFQFQKEFYTMPEWNSAITFPVFIVVLFCILSCSLSSYFACRKQLLGVPAQVLRPKPPKSIPHSSLLKSNWWNKFSFYTQWNARDLTRNKMRSFITVIGIVGCMMLILCALGMRDTIGDLTYVMYNDLHTYETKVALSETITSEQLQELQNSNYQFLQESMAEVWLTNSKETVSLTLLDDKDYIKFQDINSNYVLLPRSGVAITNKTAKLLDLTLGDTVKWRVYGSTEWQSDTIEQIIQTPMGQGIYMSKEAYNATGNTMIPTSFVTNENASFFTGPQFETVQSKNDLISSIESLMEMMNALILIMIVAAATLGIVVLYNLGALSFNEKVRELATLKVLGFQYSKLSMLLQKQNTWLTIIGILLGLPSGYALLSYMMVFMGDSLDLKTKISFVSYFTSIVGTFLLSLLVSKLLSRKLKSIDMVSALKSVE